MNEFGVKTKMKSLFKFLTIFLLTSNITHAIHGVDDVLHGALAELVHAGPLEVLEALPARTNLEFIQMEMLPQTVKIEPLLD